MITLVAGDYRMEVAPARGGSIVRLDWRGEPLMRPASGAAILDVSSFPLVPFSNRIAYGRWAVGGREGRLSPNFPGSDHPHPLHGFGWLSAWTVAQVEAERCVIEHVHEPGQWPWSYLARQVFLLDGHGITLELSLKNMGDAAMPAGLGFHPYFPRDADTVLRSRHCGEWRTGPNGLPISLDLREEPIDWWHGTPVGSRVVDTVYAGRDGLLQIDWPSRARSLRLMPSQNLTHTVIYSPEQADFFCVEPVSHATDAINAGTMPLLGPGMTLTTQLRLEAEVL